MVVLHRNSNTAITPDPKGVSVEERIKQFPNQSFKKSAGFLHCECCCMRVRMQWSQVNQHVNKTMKHVANLAKWLDRNSADHELKCELSSYFADHEDEKDATVDIDEHLYRHRTTETFMHAGVES